MRAGLVIMSGIIVGWLFGANAYAEVEIPQPQRVVDTSGTLTKAQIDTISATSKRIEDANKAVLVTLMVPSTNGEVIDDFAMRVTEKWHPGIKGVDVAAVLVIAKNDKKWAIKTTRNLGMTFTDVNTKVVMNHMRDHLKANKGDFAGAIMLFYREAEPFTKPAVVAAPVQVTQAPVEEDNRVWWLFGALGLLAAGGGTGAYFYRRRELERQAQEQREYEERERARELLRRERSRTASWNNIGAGAIAGGAAMSRPAPPKKTTASTPAPRPVSKKPDDDSFTDVLLAAAASSSWSSSRDDDSSSRSSSSSSSSSSWDFGSSSSSSSFDGGGSSSSFD